MAPIQVLFFLSLSLSINAVVLFQPLITFSNQHPNNSLLFIAVHVLLFLLVPLTFTSTIILLFVHVAVPHSDSFIQRLITASRVLFSSTLFLGTPLVAHMSFPEAVTPDTLMVMYIGSVVTAAVGVAYNFNPFEEYFDSAGQTDGSFVPTFVALGISIFTISFIDPFFSFHLQYHESASISILIQFLLALNFLNFVLAMLLLFIRIGWLAEGPKDVIPAVLIKHLMKAIFVMSFTTVLIVMCMIEEL
jgi:hypothetical protein